MKTNDLGLIFMAGVLAIVFAIVSLINNALINTRMLEILLASITLVLAVVFIAKIVISFVM